MMDGEYWTGRRTHRLEPEKKPGVFDCCNDSACPLDHFMSTLKGSYPARNKWDGVLDEHGRAGK